ncbi:MULTISPECIES: PLP-dependent aminotransferase family protein [Pseudomonas]|uniref:aminotransferase-like domain-containing protein n=1 Tax=Pseudomonas TaxID=286 RepID=UPI0006B557A0|nr:PLP-dependent aminotransferase family protein [Pseudomonas fuscovaginae]KPA98480.1 transcriptional regulator, GntR family [Pseudomonas fuscovaginae]
MKDFTVSKDDDLSLTQQLVNGICQWVEAQRMRPGTRLPSIRQLAREKQVSHSRVIEAYDRLVSMGILESRQGKGFFLTEQAATESAGAPDEQTINDAHWQPLTQFCSNRLNLCCGWMPEDWREPQAIGFAIRQVTRTDPDSLFSYGTPLGLPLLRQQIHKRLERMDVRVGHEQILTTQGVSHAMDLLVRSLLKPGDCVVVESPGYPNLFHLLQASGIRLLSVPREQDGPDIRQLEALLQCHRPRCLFINSMYHNPTGTSLRPAIAHRLLQLAEIHDFQIVEDDTYADLHNGSGTRLASLDSQNRVIYVASFSKTLSGSLRVGYLVSSAQRVRHLAQLKSVTSMGTSRFVESVVATLLGNGAYRKLVQRLRERLDKAMAQTLKRLEDHGWETFAEPVGGMFVWARCPPFSFARLNTLAAACDVMLSSGDAYYLDGQHSDWIRINVAYAGDPRALAFFQRLAAERDRDPGEVIRAAGSGRLPR